MKLLLDQGLPRGTTPFLVQAGIDAVHVGDIGHSRSEDPVILQLGLESARIVVTLDADFHTLLALSGAASPSVIRIRIEGLKAEPMAKLLQTVLAQCAADLEKGAAVTVQNKDTHPPSTDRRSSARTCRIDDYPCSISRNEP
jgi:predicted nuclease of predicted toxin-antitoxin system